MYKGTNELLRIQGILLHYSGCICINRPRHYSEFSHFRILKQKVFFMIKIDIYSGFLGAGKTTLIKKMIEEAYKGEKLVLIENEFGDIAIDGGFLQDAGVEINEMNSGCICCSLVGDFGEALHKVAEQFTPDRIIIEPSGVGKLSDVIAAVQRAGDEFTLNAYTAVVDATKCKIYLKNFGEFYNNQIESAGAVILSRTAGIKEEKLNAALELIRGINAEVTIVTTPWDQVTGKQLLDVMEQNSTLSDELKELAEHAHHHNEHCDCGHDHHHEHHDHDEHCDCGHEHHHEHHDHDEHCDCGHEHHHEHHDHDEHCDCGHDHHHEHEHGEECSCGCGHDHHHHDADEVFTSWGVETPKKYTVEQLQNILETFDEDATLGIILRAKGIVAGEDGAWLHFDYVPEEMNIRTGPAGVTGRICVIGSKLDENAVRALFGV